MNAPLRDPRQAPCAAKWLSMLFVLLCLVHQGHGQLLQWNTYGNNGGIETFEPSINNNPYVGADSLLLGAGITPSANANRFGGNGWYKTGNANPTTLANAIADNDYIEFTVRPVTGATFTPASFVFSWERSSLGPAVLSLRSSADNYMADLGSVSTSTTLASYTINISGLANRSSSITFRLYGYGAVPASSGAVGAGSGGFDQTGTASGGAVNVQLNGTTCIIPTAYTVYGGGTFCSGGSGVNVSLSGSEYGVSYQLKNNGALIGTPMAGNGSGISFGLQNSVGTYTITATRTTGGCTAAMNGSAIVAYSTADINIQGYGANIADGSTTTAPANLTNFNSVRVGSSTIRSYTIQNLGSSALSISGGSATTSEFVVTAASTTLPASASTTFTVKFTPATTGQRTAVIHISNSDCDEADYDFFVEGTGRTSAALYVDVSATGTNDGSSWANAFTDFQSALSTASAGDTVFMAQGTYKPSASISPSPTPRTATFTLTDGAVYFGGFPAGGGSIASRNFATYRTILSGDIGTPNVNTDNCFLVVNAINLTANTVLNGFTIEGGRADSAGYTIYSRASAISLGSTGAMQLESVTVRNNTVNSAVSGDGPVAWSVQHCAFENNSGYGAVYIGGVASGAFVDCAFTNNTGLNGGAISQNVNSATFSFTDCSFTGNTGTYGGGGGAINAGNAANTFINCSFTNNSSAGAGGALNKFYATANTFSYCTFSGNSGYGGGALYGQGGFAIDHCIFSQNYATGSPSTYSSHGGAIYNNGTPSSISNTVFRGNKTLYGAGGAIYNNTGGTMNLANCTFTGNNAGGYGSGGALNNNSTSNANISNCIFWGNTANGGHAAADAEIVYYSGTLNVSNTIWQGNASGGTIYNADPLFTDAATGDLTLQDCSPAIDTGASNILTTDLAGNPRPVDAFLGGLSMDLGAYERQAAPLIPEINIHDGVSAGAPHQISDGAASASAGNHTDFGSQTIGATPLSYMYTIQNTGTVALQITGSTIDNTTTGFGDFTISGVPASVSAGNTGSFTITFAPSATGARSAKIHIANNDCDERSYDFVVAGTGLCTSPTAFSVTGGGAYCSGSTAPSIGLSNSETGMSYQLYRGTSPGGIAVGGTVSGSTGNAISFGSQTTAGNYYVVATNPSGNCTTNMTGTASVTINPTPTASIAINSPALSTICKGAGTTLTFTGTSGANVTYSDGSIMPTVALTGGSATVSVSPAANTTYTLVSVTSASCTATLSGSVSVTVNIAPAFTTTTGNQTANTSSVSCDAVVNYSTMPVITGTPTPTVTYAFSGATTATGSNYGSGATFNKGVTNVLITASNTCAPAASNSFTVTVSDVTPPSITATGLAANAAGKTSDNGTGDCTTTVSLGTPTTADNCSVASLTASVGGVAITPSSYLFPIGTTIVRWTVKDGANNLAFIDQSVTVTDDESPAITAPAAVTANADAGKCYATIAGLGSPTASDNCSYTVTNDAPLNNQYPVGNTIITWTITDGASHSTTASQTVTVSDNQAPAITAPADVTVAGYCRPVTAVLATPVVSDNCGVQSVEASVGGAVINPATYLFAGGAVPTTTIVTWKVTDIHGLTTSATQNVTVNPAMIVATAVASPLYPMTGQKIQTIFLGYAGSA